MLVGRTTPPKTLCPSVTARPVEELARRQEARGIKKGGKVGKTLPYQVISPTHKRTEGRAPVWGPEFTSKDAALQGGIKQKPLLG